MAPGVNISYSSTILARHHHLYGVGNVWRKAIAWRSSETAGGGEICEDGDAKTEKIWRMNRERQRNGKQSTVCGAWRGDNAMCGNDVTRGIVGVAASSRQ